MIYLTPFLRGDGGKTWRLRNSWGASDEIVYTLSDGGSFYHVKNRNFEHLFEQNGYICRGVDTSPKSPDGRDMLYTNRSADGARYGVEWLPRYMSLGQVHTFSPLISFFYIDNGTAAHAPYVQRFWIKLAKVHARYTFHEGHALNNVLELNAYTANPASGPNVPFEQYFYAGGLVGWADKNGYSYYAGELSTSARQPRRAVSWLNIPYYPPIAQEPVMAYPTTGFVSMEARSTSLQGTNIRASKSVNSLALGRLNREWAEVQLHPLAEAAGGYTWRPIKVGAVSGWIAQQVIETRPLVVAPPPPPEPNPEPEPGKGWIVDLGAGSVVLSTKPDADRMADLLRSLAIRFDEAIMINADLPEPVEPPVTPPVPPPIAGEWQIKALISGNRAPSSASVTMPDLSVITREAEMPIPWRLNSIMTGYPNGTPTPQFPIDVYYGYHGGELGYRMNLTAMNGNCDFVRDITLDKTRPVRVEYVLRRDANELEDEKGEGPGRVEAYCYVKHGNTVSLSSAVTMVDKVRYTAWLELSALEANEVLIGAGVFVQRPYLDGGFVVEQINIYQK